MNDITHRVRSRMEAHGFPGKLLPDCMVADDYDEATGRFHVSLSRTVDTVVDGIKVHYEREIRGVIRHGEISSMTGVKAKRGLWVTVPTILAEGAHLVFKVGPIRKQVPRSAWD